MKGYVTILAALVLLAVTGAIATTLTLVSIDANKAEEALRQGEQALLFSESCLEEGLLQIIRDPNYVGESFKMPQGNCEVTAEKNNETYTIRATGKNAGFERNVMAKAILDVSEL